MISPYRLVPPSRAIKPLRWSRGALGATLTALLIAGCGGQGGPSASSLKTSAKASPTPNTGPVLLQCGPDKIQGPFHGLLLRELMRQSWLLSARDGLGRPTRDAVLREIQPTGDDRNPFDMRYMMYGPGPECSIEFEIPRELGPRCVLIHKFKLNQKDDGYSGVWRRWTAEAELLSRTKFVQALKDADFQTDAGRVAAQGDVNADIERQLAVMDAVSQFAALRRLHEQIRSDGESPRRLAALARAYAQLGVLTESHYSPVHKAFKARALLYAERLVAAHPDLAAPLWHRAFVKALIGLHRLAIDDIEAADALRAAAATKATADAVPDWLNAIDGYCHFDVKRLDAADADAAPAPLVSFLRLQLAVSSQIAPDILAAAQSLLESSPNCDNAVDAMFGIGALGTERMAVSLGNRLVSNRFAERLAALPDLPHDVRAALSGELRDAADDDDDVLSGNGGSQRCAQVVRLLRQAMAADIGEPSWGVLATLLEDANFGQAWRELMLMKFLGQPLDEFLPRWRTVAGDHPLAPAIGPPAAERKPVKPFGPGFSSVSGPLRNFDFELRERSVLSHAKPFAPNEGALDAADARGDWVYPDMLLSYRTFHFSFRLRDNYPPNPAAGVKRLLEVSPLSPQCIAAAAFNADWDSVKAQAGEWERKYEHDASVQFALGRRYATLEQPDDAERCLKRAVALAPDKTHYQELAALYAKQGDTARWLATLEEFLKQPSYGLEDDSVRVQLADHFADRHEWQKSLQYAQQAAQSGAAWAMLAAARAHEALQQWPEAEDAYRAASLAYQNQRFAWYAYCARTGKGDLSAAREVAEAYVTEIEMHHEGSDLWPVVAFHLLEGQTIPALEAIRKMNQGQTVPFYLVLGALLTDELHDFEARDALLKAASVHEADRGSPKDTGPSREYIYLAGSFVQDLASGGKGDLEFENLDQLLARAAENPRLACQYLIGYYLDLHGKSDLATEYLTRAMVSNPSWVIRTFAGQRLLARGLGPESYRAAMLQPVGPP